MITIRDVAKKAGVGVGTVSRVLNQSILVSEETRTRVMQVIEELDFRPNPAARKLSSGKSLSIAVVVPFFTRPGFSIRLNGVVSVLSSSPYDLIIYNVDSLALRKNFFLNLPRKDVVDGILFLSLPPFDDEAEILAKMEQPIVLVDSEHPLLDHFHQVRVDDVQGGYIAGKHLLDLGHRRIAFLSDYMETPFNFQSAARRYQGFCKALSEYGVDHKKLTILEGEHDRLEAREMAKVLLSAANPPTAIFATSDTQAVGVLEAARQLSINVPKELSVIGFDDIDLADIMGLTTIRQMLFKSGSRGIELLLDILDHKPFQPIHETLKIELIQRGSTSECHK